jgi:hypothetical protein
VKLVHVFTDVDMRMGHEGLKSYASRTAGLKLDALPPQTAAIFVSRGRSRMKVFSSNGVLSYMKNRGERPFDLSALAEFPRAFNPDGTLDYTRALERRLTALFKRKEPTHP